MCLVHGAAALACVSGTVHQQDNFLLRLVHSAAAVDVAVAYVACMVRCTAVLAGAGSCSFL